MTTTYHVTVTQVIAVTVDETKFGEEFMEEFRESFFPLFTVIEHAGHLGQMYARGVVDGGKEEFIEGYGPAREMGIAFEEVETDYETDLAPQREHAA